METEGAALIMDEADAGPAESINSPFAEFLRKFKRQKTALAALGFIALLVLIAGIAELIIPYGPNEYNYEALLQPPTGAHWFGTDEFGRDIFSRVLCGARISLGVGIFSVSLGAVFGTVLGLLSGYYGGLLDSAIMRACDTLFAFPGIILAIAIVALIGPGLGNVIIAVALFGTPSFARLVRSSTLAIKNSVFVQAARSTGCRDLRVLFRHILPSAVPNIIIQFSMNIGTSILTASSLSFLGMGAQAPTPEWGLMLSTGRNYMLTTWHTTFFPGLAIFFTVLSFNLLGDGLRDALDPKISNGE
jgi:glutathione transport system permease protein